MVASTTARVTLVTAAAGTVTGLPLGRMPRNTTGRARYPSLSGLLGPFR